MKKVIGYFSLFLVVVLILAAVFTYIAPHLGWRVDVVSSASTEPYLKVGSLVITRPVAPETIEVGDIITFKPVTAGETVMVHRVIAIESGSLSYFITKGDAGSRHDLFGVPVSNVIGKVCFYLPGAGYFTEFLKTIWGFIVGICIPVIIVMVMYTISIRQALRKRKTEKVASE